MNRLKRRYIDQIVKEREREDERKRRERSTASIWAHEMRMRKGEDEAKALKDEEDFRLLKQEEEARRKKKDEEMKKEEAVKKAVKAPMAITLNPLNMVSFSLCDSCIARNKGRTSMKFPNQDYYVSFTMCSQCVARSHSLHELLSK
ncbi:MAG: hypothetical protein GY821_01920 [Gammaproteobacteria bacterium]|nr:hypothetical protein [Gammaproteobacteria bacterium]